MVYLANVVGSEVYTLSVERRRRKVGQIA